jgi:hypothetical protein
LIDESDRREIAPDAWENPYLLGNVAIERIDLEMALSKHSVVAQRGWIGRSVRELDEKDEEGRSTRRACLQACKGLESLVS